MKKNTLYLLVIILCSISANAQRELIFTNCEGYKGVINENQEIIIDPIFNEIESIGYKPRLYKVLKDKKIGIYKKNIVTTGLPYTFLKKIYVDDELFFIVKNNSDFFVINQNEEPISTLKFTTFNYINDTYVLNDKNDKKYIIINGKIERKKEDENEIEIYGGEFDEYSGSSEDIYFRKKNGLLEKITINNLALYYNLKKETKTYKEVMAIYVSEFNKQNEIFYIKNINDKVGLMNQEREIILPLQYKKITQSDYNTTIFEVITKCGAIGLYFLEENKLFLPKEMIGNN